MSAFAYKLWAFWLILRASVRVKLVLLLRAMTGTKHPKGWPPDQELYIATLTAAVSNPWQDVRKLTSLFKAPNPPELQMTLVPATRFKCPGWRDSYWIELRPDLRPQVCKASLVMLYVHGGGFCFGDPLMYKHVYPFWLQQLAQQGIGMKILAVGYPLAPEHPFPKALHAVVEAYEWLVQELGTSDTIILAGDSAGGNLALSALVYMSDRAQGFPNLEASCAATTSSNSSSRSESPMAAAAAASKPPRAVLLISPAMDYTKEGPFWRPRHDQMFKYDFIVPFGESDLSKLFAPPGSSVSTDDPVLSPILIQDFSCLGSSKILVASGGCEALAGNIDQFVAHLKACNPEVSCNLQHHKEPNQPHCYPLLQVPSLVEKGGEVLVQFIVDVATTAGS